MPKYYIMDLDQGMAETVAHAARSAAEIAACQWLPENELRVYSDEYARMGGKSDWGVYQSPGALEAMASVACTRFKGIHLIEGAGHWVQQEQPGAVLAVLKEFLASPA
jgi:pimeloyl-ACP methyl ester carboxylesterase